MLSTLLENRWSKERNSKAEGGNFHFTVGNSQPKSISLKDELIAERNLQELDQYDKWLDWTSYRLQHTSEKFVNWEKNCWGKLATWRRGRTRLWRLLPTAQQNIFRICRTSFSVSDISKSPKKEILVSTHKKKKHAYKTLFEHDFTWVFHFVRFAKASDSTSTNFTLYEDRLR